mmetsp:Transcript_55693/g.82889  ORF Transcript_55693/g.82889 Transcript_55693/m.82889 type:complete len:80 (-) Transcript_55693:121-360(-)
MKRLAYRDVYVAHHLLTNISIESIPGAENRIFLLSNPRAVSHGTHPRPSPSSRCAGQLLAMTKMEAYERAHLVIELDDN